MIINCENYREGMCIYVSKDLESAIFEKCYLENITEKYRENFVENCRLRETIKILEKRNNPQINHNKNL